MHRQSFGRRVTPVIAAERQPDPAPATRVPDVPELSAPPPELDPTELDDEEMQSIEEELEAWKRERRGTAQFPWRSMLLMASLCFGIASFVLPESVNDMFNWVLYGLTAICFTLWLKGRRRTAET